MIHDILKLKLKFIIINLYDNSYILLDISKLINYIHMARY